MKQIGVRRETRGLYQLNCSCAYCTAGRWTCISSVSITGYGCADQNIQAHLVRSLRHCGLLEYSCTHLEPNPAGWSNHVRPRRTRAYLHRYEYSRFAVRSRAAKRHGRVIKSLTFDSTILKKPLQSYVAWTNVKVIRLWAARLQSIRVWSFAILMSLHAHHKMPVDV